MEQYTFRDTDDYFKKLEDEIGLLKKVNDINISSYKINKELGEGYFDYLKAENGIEIAVINFKLLKAIEYKYKLKKKGFELIYCLDGEVNCRDYQMDSDLLIKAGEIHFWRSNRNSEGWFKYPKNKNIRGVNIYFDETFFEKLSFNGVQDIKRKLDTNDLCQVTKKLNIPEMIVPFKQIAACSWDCEPFSEILYLQSKAVEIISLFINYEFFKEASDNKVITKDEDIAKIKKARSLISSNLVDPLAIGELSQEIGLNTYKLKKGFKEVYNTTIFSYLRSIRMEKARGFLLKNNENILEIANRVGYSNSSHFAAAFRDKYGVNPSVYRENMRNLKSIL